MLDKQDPNQVSNLLLCEVLAWNFNSIHIFKRFSSITKKGEIESPSLVLVIECQPYRLMLPLSMFS
jgi:hypothetical protein